MISIQNAQNPAKKFIKWSGSPDDKCFNYYDKATAKTEVIEDDTLYVVTLDILSTIKGFSEKDVSGIWSNEVPPFDLKQRELIVQTKNGVLVQGIYSEIKTKIVTAGGKYAASLYAVILKKKEDGSFFVPTDEIVNFQLFGSAFINWYKLGLNGGISCVIKITKEQEPRKKGAVKYYCPKYELIENPKGDLLKYAQEKNKVLQKFLSSYLSQNDEKVEENNGLEVFLEDYPEQVDIKKSIQRFVSAYLDRKKAKTEDDQVVTKKELEQIFNTETNTEIAHDDLPF